LISFGNFDDALPGLQAFSHDDDGDRGVEMEGKSGNYCPMHYGGRSLFFRAVPPGNTGSSNKARNIFFHKKPCCLLLLRKFLLLEPCCSKERGIDRPMD
jgi:hypothetical protein